MFNSINFHYFYIYLLINIYPNLIEVGPAYIFYKSKPLNSAVQSLNSA